MFCQADLHTYTPSGHNLIKMEQLGRHKVRLHISDTVVAYTPGMIDQDEPQYEL